MKRSHGMFVPKAFAALALTTAVAVAGIAVLNLFNRTGEAAVRLVPANAALVVSFDNTPSPAQAVLFNRIRDAVKSSGMDQWIDDLLSQWDHGTGVLAELRSHVRGSFAFAVFPSEDMKNPDALLALSLSDPAGAENLVREYTHSEVRDGVRFYWGEKKDGYIAFYKDYALLSNKQEVILQAFAVGEGKARSVYDDVDFQAARGVLPSDATLMVFLNGRVLAEGDPEAVKGLQALGIHREGWLSLGITLREEGVVIDGALPALKEGLAQALREAGALNFEGMANFPRGAVALMGVSNPARFFEFALELARLDPKSEKDAEKGIRDLETETGMSFEREWLPAFRGEFLGALYPPREAGGNPQFVLGLDNQHNGKATEFAVKFFEKANAGQFDKEGKQPRFTSEVQLGWRVFRPTDQPQIAFAVSDQQVLMVTDPVLLDEITRGNTRGHFGQNLLRGSRILEAVQENPRLHLRLDTQQILNTLEQTGSLPPELNLRRVLTREDLTVTLSMDSQFVRLHVVIPVDIAESIRTLMRAVSGGAYTRT